MPALDWLRQLRKRDRRGYAKCVARIQQLYFFHGRNGCVLAHGLTKEGPVPAVDVDRALARKVAFERDPEAHTFEMDHESDG